MRFPVYAGYAVETAKEAAMFSVTPNGPNRLDLVFNGKLDSTAMRTALDELVAKSEGIEHGRMLYTVGEFDFPTLGAIGVELSRLPELFRMIARFDRCAVIADKAWVRNVSELEGLLVPVLEIRAFSPGQEAEAEAWLAE